MPQWESVLRPISWRAQQRLYARLRRLGAQRGDAAAYTAVGRALCGYVCTSGESQAPAFRPGSLTYINTDKVTEDAIISQVLKFAVPAIH